MKALPHSQTSAAAAASASCRQPSERELEVLRMIAQGKTTREIASALFITDNTVEAHRRSLFRKLGAVNAAHLVMRAVEHGFLSITKKRP